MMSKLLSFSAPPGSQASRVVSNLLLSAVMVCCGLAIAQTASAQCTGAIAITNNPISVPKIEVNCPSGPLMLGPVSYTLSFGVSVPQVAPGSVVLDFTSNATHWAVDPNAADNVVPSFPAEYNAGGNPQNIASGSVIYFRFDVGTTYDILINADPVGVPCPQLHIFPGQVTPVGSPGPPAAGAVCFPNAPTGFPVPDLPAARTYLCEAAPGSVTITNSGTNGSPIISQTWTVTTVNGGPCTPVVTAGGDGTNSVTYDFSSCLPGEYRIAYCERGGGSIVFPCGAPWGPNPQPCTVCDTTTVVIYADPDVTGVPANVTACNLPSTPLGPYNFDVSGTATEQAATKLTWTITDLLNGGAPVDIGTGNTGDMKTGTAGNEIPAFNAVNTTNDNINAQICVTAQRLLPDGTACGNLPLDPNCDFNIFVCAEPNPTLVSPATPITVCSGSPFTLTVHSSLFDGNLVENAAFRWQSSNVLGVTGDNDPLSAAVSQTTDFSINETLTNNTLVPQTINYTFRVRNADPNCVNCTEEILVVPVTVVPNFTINAIADQGPFCPLDVVAIQIGTTPNVLGIGAPVSWTSSVPWSTTGNTGINVPTINPIIGINPPELLTQALPNTTGMSIVSTVTVTVDNADPCTDDTEEFLVTVCPRPVLEEIAAPDVCSGVDPLTFTIRSNLKADNTAFTFNGLLTTNNPNISGEQLIPADPQLLGSGFTTASVLPRVTITQGATYDEFTFTIPTGVVNNTNTPQTVTYVVTARDASCGNCVGLPIAVTITVNPNLTVATAADEVFCSRNDFNGVAPVAEIGPFTTTPGPGNVAVNYTITGGTVNGVAVTAAVAADLLCLPVTGQVAANGTRAICIPENLNNTNTIINFELVSEGDCQTAPATPFNVVIRPEPNLVPITDQRTCSGQPWDPAAVEFQITNNDAGADGLLGGAPWQYYNDPMGPGCSGVNFPAGNGPGFGSVGAPGVFVNDDGNDGPAPDQAGTTRVNNTLNSWSRLFQYRALSSFGCLSPLGEFDAILDPAPVYVDGVAGPVCSGATVNIPLTTVPYWSGTSIKATDFSWTAVANPPGSVMGFTANQPAGVPTTFINDQLFNMMGANAEVIYTITPYALSAACGDADVAAAPCAGTPFNITVTVTPSEFKIPDILTADGPYCVSDPCVDLLDETQVNLGSIAAALGPDVNWRWLVNDEVFIPGPASGPLAALYVAPGPAASHGGFDQGAMGGATFCPNIAGPGVHIVCLEFFEDVNDDAQPDPNGCVTMDCRTFIVYPEYNPAVWCPAQVCVSSEPIRLRPVEAPDFENDPAYLPAPRFDRFVTFGLAGGPATNPDVATSQVFDPQGNVIEDDAFATWSGNGVVNPANSPDAEFDALAAVQMALGNALLSAEELTTPVVIAVQYEVGYDQCRKYGNCNIEVVPTNKAVVADLAFDCTIDPQGNFDLSSLLQNAPNGQVSTPGGTWTLESGPGTASIEPGTSNLQYLEPGCYNVRYSVPFGLCPDVTDDGFIQIKEQPTPDFVVDALTICKNELFGASEPIVVQLTSPSYSGIPTYQWTATAQDDDGDPSTVTPVEVFISDETTATPTIFVFSTTMEGGKVDVCLTETLTYEDCGNFPGGECSATKCITIEVKPQPTITCPTDITVNADVDKCGANIVVPTATAVDYCGFAEVLRTDNGPASGDFFEVGTYTITYRTGAIEVAPVDGMNECSFDIVVRDMQTPHAVCRDFTVELDALGNASISAALAAAPDDCFVADLPPTVDGGSSDNCTALCDLVLSASETEFDCDDKGVKIIKLKVTDAVGNSSTCNATVTVVDRMKPDLDCSLIASVTVNNTPDKCYYRVAGDEFDPTVTDNCLGVTLSNDYNFSASLVGARFEYGVTAVVWTATDLAGNTKTCVSYITVNRGNPQLTVTLAQTTPVSCQGYLTGSLTATAVSGTGPYTFQWYNNADTKEVKPGPAPVTSSITGLFAGTYLVIVTDADGCTASDIWLLHDPEGLNATITAYTDITCNGGTNGSATVSVTGGTAPYDYAWEKVPGGAVAGGTTMNTNATSNTVNNLAAGFYRVTVTDDRGCQAIALIEIEQPTKVIVDIADFSNVLCFGGITGMATANATGGTPPYTYDWSNNGVQNPDTDGPKMTGLAAGTYDVTVTDANGCTGSTSVTITQPTELIIPALTMTPVKCLGGADGMLEASPTGGVLPYHYLWSNGSTDKKATGLAAGTYTVTVTDGNGCTAVNTGTVTQPVTSVTVTLSDIVNPDCEGKTTGSVKATANGGTSPYSFKWSTQYPLASQGAANVAGPDAMHTATGLFAGTWFVTVTDANGCTAVASVVLADPTGVTAVVISHVDVKCFGECTGTATAQGSGGAGGYTYMWSTTPMQTTQTATGLCAGQYTVTVKDSKGCAAVAVVEITQPTKLIVETISITPTFCAGSTNTGAATVNATGGTTPYTYDWSNDGPENPDNDGAGISGVAADTYTVTVTDANGCTATTSVVIPEGPALTISELPDLGFLCANDPYRPGTNPFAGNDGDIIGPIYLFSTPFSTDTKYTWSGGAAAGLPDGMATGTNPFIPAWQVADAPGNYTVTVTAMLANGCVDTEIFTFAVLQGPGNPPLNDEYHLYKCEETFGSGKAYFILENALPAILKDFDPLQVQLNLFKVTFHRTLQDAELNKDRLQSPYYAGDQTDIYVRVQNVITKCFSTTRLRLHVWPSPKACSGNISACPVNAGNDYAYFDIPAENGAGNTYLYNQVTSCNPGTPPSYDAKVKFYLSQTAAELELDAYRIAPGAFLSNSRVIWVRVENGIGCADVDIVNLEVLQSPSVVVDFTHESCAGAADGTILATAVAGKSPFNFNWSAGVTLDPTKSTPTSSAVKDLAPGVYTVTLTDANGCTTTASVTIMPGDPLVITELPNITICPETAVLPIELSATPKNLLVYYTWTGGAVAGLPNMNPPGIDGADPEIPGFITGDVEGTWTVTVTGRYRGCVDTEDFTITVKDDIAPVFIQCPGNMVVNADVDKCSAVVKWSEPLAEDECEPDVIITQTAGSASGSVFNVGGPYTITYKADDTNGNTTICEFTVTVRDMQLPDVACPTGTQTFGTNNGLCTWTAPNVATLNATATDNCSVASLTNNFTGTSTIAGAVFPLGTTMVTWTAVDASNNTRTCIYRVVVVDDDIPTVTACNANITTNTDPGICGAAVNYTVTFADNCGGTATLVNGLTSGSTFPIGITQVEWSYNDLASNGPVNCSFTVTVIDNEKPSITCPANVVVNIGGTPAITGGPATLVGSGPCGVTLSYTAPVGTDNCPGVVTSLVSGLGAGPNFYEYGGFYTETYNVVDDRGNKATCSFSITVKDPINPTITCPANTTVATDPGECDAAVSYAFPYSGDNCPNFTLVKLVGPNSGEEFNLGTTQVKFEVTDPTGNKATCDFTVTVEDRERPVINSCPPPTTATTSSNGTGDCSGAVPNMVPSLAASDNCTPLPAINQIPAPGSSFGSAHGDVQIITFYVADGAGNTSSCQSTVRLVDNEAPSIVCTGLTTSFTTTPGICGHLVVAADNVNPSFGDNCAGAKRRHNFPTAPSHWTLEGAVLPVGTTTVIWTITDINNNTTSCSVIYTVTDNTAPIFVNCPVDITVGNDVDKCGRNVFWTAPIAIDDCQPVTVTQTATAGFGPGALFPVGTTLVSYKATDPSGNMATCSWRITVTDMQIPNIQCPSGIQDIATNIACTHVVSGTALNATATDNCAVTSLTHSYTNLVGGNTTLNGATFPLGATVVTWTARDAAGNSRSCTYTVLVQDLTDPQVQQCPTNISTVTDPNLCTAVVTYVVWFQDNCDGGNRVGTRIEGLASGSAFPLGTTTVIHRYVDAASNDFAECQFTVTVRDFQTPAISCPTNIIVNTNGTISGGTGGSPAANPTITAFGPCGVNLRYNAPVGTDNCPNASTVNVSGFGAGPNYYAYNGVYTETWRVTDASGNSTACSFTITVQDAVAPTITCPASTTVNNDAGECDAVVDYSFPYYSDNCTNFTLTQLAGPNSGEEFPVGTTAVSFRVTDNAGNSTVCSFSVTVLDNEDPIITTCPPARDIVTSSNGTGDCSGAVPNLIPEVVGTDNCTLATPPFTQSPAAGTSFGAAHNDMIFVTITATDIYGNSSTCQVKLTLKDDERPTINCANIPTALNNTPGYCHYFVPGFNLNPTFSDNCGPLVLTNSLTGNNTLGGTPLAVGSTTVNWTVTDANGNTSACSVTYVVTDNEPPVARCQGPQIDVVLDGDGLGQLLVADVSTESTDNCGPITVGIKREDSASPFGPSVLFSCADAFYVPTFNRENVVLQVVDQYGNISRCTTSVTVLDLESPVITCPNGVETVTDPALCTAIVNGIGLQYSNDNCPTTTTYTITGATTTSGNNDASGTVFNKGTSVVTYTVVDQSGNFANCSFDVEVEDAELPVIDCSSITNLTRSNNTDECGYTVVGTEFDPASFGDNCTGATITNNYNNSASLAGAEFPVGTTLVIWTVTDASGNTITCISKVTINDTQLPTITCATLTATTFTNDLGQCSKTILSNVIDAAFADNCPRAELSHNYVTAPNPWTLSGATFPVGTTNVIFTVTDASGNTATCSINVVVTDTEKPTFVNCPTEMVMVGNDVDKCSAKVNWPQPVAEDNCDILAVTQVAGPGSGTEIAVGAPFTVTYRATDVNGNTQNCTFQVQVVDTQKPQFDADIVMPADVTVQCDAVPAPFVLTNNDVFDNCTPSAQLVITYTQTSTQGANPVLCSYYDYVITRTWKVTDAAGNMLVHTQVITVKDTTKPIAKCKDATVTLDKFGNVSITGSDINNGSTDNCATNYLTFTVSPNSFNCSKLGANTVTLVVTDPCGNSATCQATVTVVQGIGKCQPEYDLANSVKCACKNNATTDVNGQFDETIQIIALAGQTWTLTENNGLFASNSPAPPAAPTALPIGTTMVMGSADGIDNNKNGVIDEADEMIYYTLKGIHVDGIGYTVTLKNAQGQALTISNKCYYPTPIFLNLNDPFCLSTPAFEIKVGDNYGAAGTVTSITINGVPSTIFDAKKLGEGSHKVAATFDAGTATPFITVNGVVVSGSDAAALADPGCQQMIMQFVNVVGTPSQIVCNDNLFVSLENDCTFTLTPDDVMEGSYFCYDDYKVELDKAAPFGNGPWVPANLTAADIGKTYFYRVTHLLGNNICWGNVTIEDKLPPVLTCPADKQILCVQDEDNLALTGQPTWTDCSNVTVTRQDDYVQYDCAQNAVVFTRVLRTWVATDAWGNSATCLQIIDKIRGEISQVNWPSDKEYECNNLPGSTDPFVTGWPTVGGVNLTTNGSGSCGLSVSYTDEEAAVCPGSYKIIRTWKITDWCTPSGNPESATHVQYIKVLDVKPTIDFSNFTYDPDHGWYNLSAKSAFGGQCVASGPLPIAIIDGVCNNVVQVKITTPVGLVTNGGLIPAPGLSIGQHPIKYFVEDECGNITSITIIVNVIDDTPPAVACDEFTQVALSGNGEAEIFAATFDDKTWDNCCLDYFEVARMNGDCNGQPDDFGPSVKFCCSDINDTITVVFRAWDCNKNSNDCMVRVFVEDKIRPVCTSPATVTVTCENFDPSLWAYGFATGVDNCCLDTITTTTNYSQFDTLCNRGTLTRTFRVFDCAGNSTQCTQRIFVNYEQDYYVKFPDDRLLTVCDGTGNYGEPQFLNKDCELLGVSFTDEIFTVVPDACYKIERTWHVINWCQYNSNVPLTPVPNPNPNATVNSPANNPGATISASSNPNVVAAPWTATRLAIVPGAQPTDYSVFYTGGTYTFNNQTITVPSILLSNGFSYKQIIKVVDNQDPTIDDCPASPVEFCDLTPNDAALWNEAYWYDSKIESHNLCEGPVDLNITATDACSAAAVNIKYLLFLDTDNNGSMETVISSTNLPGFNNVNFNNAGNPNFTGGIPQAFDGRPVPSNQKYGFAIQTTISGNKKTAAVRWNTFQSQNTYVIPELPYGTHKIKWIVEDGCGNEAICEYTFVVKDCKAPTVVCKNGLSVNIMPTGMITLWASDFLEYTEDNCTPSNKIIIGIRRVGQPDGQGNITGFPRNADGTPQTSVTFTCTDGLGQQEVEIWAMDLANNSDFCQTFIVVQDNAGVCNPDKATVAGALKTEEAKGLEEASVELSSPNLAAPIEVMTDKAGAYNFGQVPKNNDYTITPTHDVNPLNGVSTYDLVLISKHILGLESLNSPYKMIAADANKSGSITTFDIVELRKLILGIYTELPNNTSWRFVDKSYNFTEPSNPFKDKFPESKSLVALSAPQIDEDFVAIKVGDLNGSATANSLMSSEDRTAGTLLFDVTDRTVKAGEVFEVTFKAAEQVKGYQFTMNLNGLVVEEVVPGDDMSNLNFGVFPGADYMTTSYDGKATGEFTVMFRATKSGKLSQMLGVSSRITRAESYAFSGDRNTVALRFNGSIIAGIGFELYQNEPNPFVNKTFIGFHLPEAATATLTVRDETGRTLFTQKGDFAKGYNSIAVERELLPSVGVLYYTLETATDSATKKMIQTK